MAVVGYKSQEIVAVLPDPSYVVFVGKVQKAKTRKNKSYFVLRTTIPKDVAEEIKAEPGDYLFFKAKKAQWYHMLDWSQMANAWNMLPKETKIQAILDGVYRQGVSGQAIPFGDNLYLGATNPSLQTQQIVSVQANQVGDMCGSSL